MRLSLLINGKNGPFSASFCLPTFILFESLIGTIITLDFSGIRIQIIGEEGKLADHLTTKTLERVALNENFLVITTLDS